jgi:putative transposase
MSTYQADLSVTAMSEFFDVSRSGYYAWLNREQAARDAQDARLTETIKAIHKMSGGTYGAPRIQVELREEHDIRVSQKRVARLMKSCGLSGVTRRKRPRTTHRDESHQPASDLVNREFTASAPDRLWVGDITYVPTLVGFLYLAVVLDVWSRKVVGWAMADHLRTELVISALDMATLNRDAKGVIFHSDQGSQYTSAVFGKRCDREGVRPSMGSVGDCYDNALCESFFATLECELLDRTLFADHDAAKRSIFAWLESWYNGKRRHSSIDYMSPNEYENKQNSSLERAAA